MLEYNKHKHHSVDWIYQSLRVVGSSKKKNQYNYLSASFILKTHIYSYFLSKPLNAPLGLHIKASWTDGLSDFRAKPQHFDCECSLPSLGR